MTKNTATIDIYVLGSTGWKHRTTVEMPDAENVENRALRQYGIRGTRPRLGEATSKSGKRFCAVKRAA